MFTKRTDLAREAHALWQEGAKDAARLPGVRRRIHRREGCPVTRLDILNEAGEAALGKPAGSYRTVDLSAFLRREEDFFARAVRAVGQELKELLPAEGSVLVAGLGNAAMTPDALGPLALE